MSRPKSRSGSRTPVYSNPGTKKLSSQHKNGLEQLKHEAMKLEHDHLELVNALKKVATQDEAKHTVQSLKAELRRKERQLYEEKARACQLRDALHAQSSSEKENQVPTPSSVLEEAKADMKVLYREIKHLNESVQYYKQKVEMLETCWTRESLGSINGLSATKEVQLHKEIDQLSNANKELAQELSHKNTQLAEQTQKLHKLKQLHQHALASQKFDRQKEFAESLIATASDHLFTVFSDLENKLGPFDTRISTLSTTLNEFKSSFNSSLSQKTEDLQRLNQENARLQEMIQTLQTESLTKVTSTETETNKLLGEIQQLQDTVSFLTTTKNTAELAQIKLAKAQEKKHLLQANLQQSQEAKEHALKNVEALAQELEAAAAANFKLQKDQAQAKEELKEVTFKYEKSIEQVLLTSDQVQALTQQVKQLQVALDTCKAEKLQQEAQLQSVVQTPPQLTIQHLLNPILIEKTGCQECQSLQSELNRLQEERKKAVQILQSHGTSQTALQQAEQECRVLKAALAEAQDDKKSLSKEVASLKRDKAKLREELRQCRTPDKFAERLSVGGRPSSSRGREDLNEKLAEAQAEFVAYKASADVRQRELEAELSSALEEITSLKRQIKNPVEACQTEASQKLRQMQEELELCKESYCVHLTQLDAQVTELEQEKAELQAQLDAELSKEVRWVLEKNATDTELLQTKEREAGLLAQVQELTRALEKSELAEELADA